MKIPHLGFPLLALAFALALAPAATAQEAGEAVPPENSAVNQYTEPFPSAGGERDVHEQKGREASPGKVLGPRKARRLERQGEAGRELAELTAETAPAPSTAGDGEGAGQGSAGGPAGGDGSGGGRAGGAGGDGEAGSPSGSERVELPATSGSSGLGAILSHALGTGAGGPLLPLLILATIVWAIAYASRQRQTAA